MRTISYLVMIWVPIGIGLLMLLAGIANRNAHLIIVGLIAVGVSSLFWLFLKNAWKSHDERKSGS